MRARREQSTVPHRVLSVTHPLTRLSWSLTTSPAEWIPGASPAEPATHATNHPHSSCRGRRLLAAATGEGSQDGLGKPELSAAALAALVFGVHPLGSSGCVDLRAGPTSCAAVRAPVDLAYLPRRRGFGPARRGPLLVSVAALRPPFVEGCRAPARGRLCSSDIYPLRAGATAGERPAREDSPPAGDGRRAGITSTRSQGAVTTGAAATGQWPASGGGLQRRRHAGPFVWRPPLPALRDAGPGQLVEPVAPGDGRDRLVTALISPLRAGGRRSGRGCSPRSCTRRPAQPCAGRRPRARPYSYLAGLGFACSWAARSSRGPELVRRGALTRRVARAATSRRGRHLGLGATPGPQPIWGETETLWGWAIDLDPTCSTCHGKLGESLLWAGRRVARGEAEGFSGERSPCVRICPRRTSTSAPRWRCRAATRKQKPRCATTWSACPRRRPAPSA